MYGGQASLGRACADLFQQARLNTDCKINFPGWVGVVGKAENIATQPSLAGAWAELGNNENYSQVLILFLTFKILPNYFKIFF